MLVYCVHSTCMTETALLLVCVKAEAPTRATQQASVRTLDAVGQHSKSVTRPDKDESSFAPILRTETAPKQFRDSPYNAAITAE
jgi:hypothetical protein